MSAATNCTVRSASQSGEEVVYMDRFMPKVANGGGTYVEIGALDGHRFSNTRVLSKCHGWRGLLVEANLQNYNHLLMRMDRTNVTVRHSAVCEPPQRWTSFTPRVWRRGHRHDARLPELRKGMGTCQSPREDTPGALRPNARTSGRDPARRLLLPGRGRRRVLGDTHYRLQPCAHRHVLHRARWSRQAKGHARRRVASNAQDIASATPMTDTLRRFGGAFSRTGC
eukprot:scaffold1526_cov35-Tisochrysis_lutea.AAC.1